jgi:hypothetical protein
MRLALVVAIALVTLTGAASARTIVGTNGNDILSGTQRADVEFGRGGADRIFGGAGADLLEGGPGADLFDGGPGNDRIVAQYDGPRDTVRCGPGIDVVNADPLDRVAADCELVGRRLSRDPYGNPESQHQTEVEPDSFTFGQRTVAAYQVGRRLDGGSTNIGVSVSRDDGRHWSSFLLPSLTTASRPAGTADRVSDPALTYDALHGTWLVATLVIEGQTSRLAVSRSAEGIGWSAPVAAVEATSEDGVSFDKEWVACDNRPASPLRGRCYLVYTDTLHGDTLGVVFSTDGGITWSRQVDAPVDDIVGAFPVIRPDGELVVPFLWHGTRIGVTTSSDGALTFAAPVVVADVQAHPTPGLRFFPLPSADVDPSGHVWIAWHDCRFSAGCTTNDVVVVASVDAVHWTGPVEVTSGRNAVIPAIGINPTSGRVAIAYYTVRPSGIDAELVESRIGASSFGAPRRLSAQTMPATWLPDTASGRMLADYISLHYAGARPLAVWALASQPVGESFRQAIYATRG